MSENQRIEFRNQLSLLSDTQIIERFNQETGHNGWGKSRSIFLIALKDEFDSREMDYSEIGDFSSLSLGHKVKLVDKKILKID